MRTLSAFFSRRLARDDPHGLPLTLGLTISLLALTLFLVLVVEVRLYGGPQDTFDWRCAEAMKHHAEGHPELRGLMRLLTHLGGVPAMVVFSVVGAALLWWRHYRLLAVGWAIAAAGGGLMNMGTKLLIDRERPPVQILRDEAATETSKSFPSGHSMGSIIGYGMLGYVITLLVRRGAERVAAIALLVVLVLLIGFSRIYLRAHWFSDVLGGFAIGTFWVSLCITWIETHRRRLRARA
jgi:membrane-associated phospholipid phosphatase